MVGFQTGMISDRVLYLVVKYNQEFKKNVLGSHSVRVYCTDMHVSSMPKPVM